MNIIQTLAKKELLLNYKQKNRIKASEVAKLYMDYDKQIEEYVADTCTMRQDDHWVAMLYYYKGSSVGQNKKIDVQLTFLPKDSAIRNLCEAVIADNENHTETVKLKLLYAKKAIAKHHNVPMEKYVGSILDMVSPRKQEVKPLPELNKRELAQLDHTEHFIYAKYLQMAGNEKESKKQFEELASDRIYSKSHDAYDYNFLGNRL